MLLARSAHGGELLGASEAGEKAAEDADAAAAIPHALERL